MIDVVFLLIVFFLVSSHLARQESQLPLPLPAADTGEETRAVDGDRVVVNILADGSVLLTGRAVSPDQLQHRLQHERERSRDDFELRIRCDRSVPYRFVRPVLLAAARAGIWNVTFAVTRREART
jgi:biopolymer transport protein ExbD